MAKILNKKFSKTDKLIAFALSLLALAFVLLTLIQDYLRSAIKNSSFYFSESILFSSFWCLFAPLLFIQYLVVKNSKKIRLAILVAIILAAILIHLVAYAFFVWILSSIFYYHTFPFLHIINYTLAEHFYLLVIMYSIPVLVLPFLYKKTGSESTASELQKADPKNPYISTILISLGNKKQHVNVSTVFYFSANPPYIDIHLEEKKHLHNETLKSILSKLDPEKFVMVHKSTIVNIEMVDAYSSRFNGDYDLILKNGEQLRLSRNFAANFKKLFNEVHRLTPK